MVIVCSGGVDSVAVAYEERHHKPLLMFFDFGQPARAQERHAARACAAFLKLELVERSVDIPGVGAMFSAQRHDVVQVVGPRLMPGRNLALLSLAVAYAAATGRKRVLFGAIADDQRDYPDCRVEFVQALRTTTEIAYGVRVDAPFLHLPKREVAKRLPHELLALCWSCYEPVNGAACGACNSCVGRQDAEDALIPW